MLAQKFLNAAQAGSSVVLYVLIALSVLSIAIIVDRWLWFRRRRIDLGTLGRELGEHLRLGNLAEASLLLGAQRGIEPQIIQEALRWYEDGPDTVEQVIARGIREQRKEIEAGLLFLGTLGNNAPFIGLFGTVLGVVTAFRELGTSSAGAMGNVMAGIAEALVATAIGILVALPAVVAYNIFQKRGADIEENTQALGAVVLGQLKSRREVAVHRLAAVHREPAKVAEGRA